METISGSNLGLINTLQRYQFSPLSGKENSKVAGHPVPSEKTIANEKITISQEGREMVSESQLSVEDLKLLNTLKKRDREVRAHEQAHLSVAGQYASGAASFTTEKGPDGKSYATGGKVPIDISSENSPEATIAKMRTVKRAALAPANPSPADRMIAAAASAKESQARKELLLVEQEELLQAEKTVPETDPGSTPPHPSSIYPSFNNSHPSSVSVKMMAQTYQTVASN